MNTGVFEMENPFVYYRIDSLTDLKRDSSYSVIKLDWRSDLAMIQKLYARFNKTVNPDAFDQYVGNPLAILQDGVIVSFAIPLSFRESEIEMGGVATIPDQQNKGCCKSLLSEMAFRILKNGKAAMLTTEKSNVPMQKAAESIGMKRVQQNHDPIGGDTL